MSTYKMSGSPSRANRNKQDTVEPAISGKARLRRPAPESLLALAVLLALLLAWEALARFSSISDLILPAPSAVFNSLQQGLLQGNLLWHTGVTLYEITAGFGIGVVVGVVLGSIIALVPMMEKVFYPYMVAFQSIPKVAIAPIIIVWFGFDTTSKVIITATISFFPVLAGTIAGLRAAPADQIEMLLSLTANRRQVFWKVRIPQSLPYIFVGLDVAATLSVIGAIVGEFVGAQAGLGFIILQRNQQLDMAGVFAILIILSLIGVALHLIIRYLQRRIVFWGDDEKQQFRTGPS